MKELFDGLLLYEITLLLLGVILFLILSVGLLYYIIKKEQIAKLLFFFFIPIVMIGYPSITQITISNDKIELSKLHHQVMENPDDTVAVQKMEQLTEKLEKRASTSDDLVQVSTSNLLLGNNERATTLAEKALTKDSTNTAARDIKKLASFQENLKLSPVREQTSTVREETNLSARTPAPAETTAETPTLEAVPQARIDTAVIRANPQLNNLKQMEVTNDLTRVKSFLINKSVRKLDSARESDK